jgi:hypothetical protein
MLPHVSVGNYNLNPYSQLEFITIVYELSVPIHRGTERVYAYSPHAMSPEVGTM